MNKNLGGVAEYGIIRLVSNELVNSQNSNEIKVFGAPGEFRSQDAGRRHFGFFTVLSGNKRAHPV
jgi:hypothetical protein